MRKTDHKGSPVPKLYFKVTGKHDTYYAMLAGNFYRPITSGSIRRAEKDIMKTYRHFDKIFKVEMCSEDEYNEYVKSLG